MSIAAKVASQMQAQSWIRQMFEVGLALKAQHGARNVFDLSLGNPILEPPAAFYARLRQILDAPPPGGHRYMPNAGYPETRAAVAAQLAKDTGRPFAGSDVVMTIGAAGGLNVVFKSILDPGDEVVVLAPFFPEYLFYIDNHNGVPVIAETDDGFLPDAAALEAKLTARTKAVLLNSPNNPTGVVYPSAVLNAVGEVLARAEARFGHTIYLVSDEPYAKLLYDDASYPYVYQHHPASIGVVSYSKDLSLAGERIGYVAVNTDCPDKGPLMDALIFSNRVLGFVNAPALMQRAVEALQGVAVDTDWYKARRDRLYQGLFALGFDVVKPGGAFYLFPKSPIPNDVDFVQSLLGLQVLVVPGTGFGRPGYFRMSYSVENWVIDGALERISAASATLGLAPA
ncbi:MAG: pyridoxal phosphate-dependent aminotransferase [Dehalococcoidia bacterium]|nr:pyridoxal phosphate-dependent aminotransferase [Dehalococcoidia bacterium]